MATIVFDARGQRCPLPVLAITQKIVKKEVTGGDVLEVVADCPTFRDEVKKWCSQSRKVLIYMREEGNNTVRCQIQI